MTKPRDLATLGGGFTQSGTGAIQRTVENKLKDTVSVKDFGAVGDGTTDDTTAINLAVGQAGKDVYFPAGTYLITRPINLTTRREGDAGIPKYCNRRIFGAGMGATKILAATSGYPAIDITGASGVTLSGFSINADNTILVGVSNAAIGIMNRRGTSSANTAYCHSNFYQDIKIFLTSNFSLNGGAGSIPYFHFGGEHVAVQNISCYGNLPMWMGNIWPSAFSVLSSSSIATYGTEYEIGATTSASTTANYFANTILVSYDSFRALTLVQVGASTFSDLYCSSRAIVGGASPTSDLINVSFGGAGLNITCFEEGSGLYGSTYKTDHYYINVQGALLDSNIDIIRAYMAAGITDPGVLRPAINIQTASIIDRCFIRAIASQAAMDATSGNPGLASSSIEFQAGTGQRVANSTLVLDNATHNNELLTGTNYFYNNITNNYNRLNRIGANILTSDRIGLNVTAPNTYLQIQNSTAKGDYIKLDNPTNATLWEAFGVDGNGGQITGNPALNLITNGAYRLTIDSTGNTRPGADNTNSLGVSGGRWSVVYAATGTINTSDEREKQDICDLDAAEKRVAQALKGLVKKFRFKDAVSTKGQDARVHVGLIAQEVIEAFEAEGLDAQRYGMLCYDEWDEEEAVIDEDGNVLREAVAAGERYGIRYEELLAFIIAAL